MRRFAGGGLHKADTGRMEGIYGLSTAHVREATHLSSEISEDLSMKEYSLSIITDVPCSKSICTVDLRHINFVYNDMVPNFSRSLGT